MNMPYRKITTYIVIFVLLFEHMAYAAVPPRSSPDLIQQSSEVYRDQQSTLINRAERLDLNPNLYEEFKEFSISTVDDEIKEQLTQILESEKELVWKLFGNTAYMIVSAKNNRFDQAYKYRDGLVGSLLKISEKFSSYPRIRDHIVTTSYQWALVSAGTVDINQRKRIDYILSVLVSDIVQVKDHVVGFAKTHETEKMGLGVLSGFGIFLYTTFASASFFEDLSLVDYDLVNLAFGFSAGSISITIWLYLIYLIFVDGPARDRISNLVKIKILNIYKSYTDTLSQAQIKKIPKGYKYEDILSVSDENQVTDKFVAKKGFLESLSEWLYTEPTSKNSHNIKVDESAQAIDSNLNDRLKKMFLYPVSKEKDIEIFFDSVGSDSNLQSQVDQAIREDNELFNLAEKGRSFREAYLEKLSSAFGDHTTFSIDPESSILQRLNIADKVLESVRQVEVTLQQAEALALEETIQRFNLPRDTESSRLEVLKYTSNHWMQVYDYYRKRFFMHQSKEVPRVISDQVDLDQFKKMNLKDLYSLRERNFISGIKNFKITKPQIQNLRIQTHSGIVDVSVIDLMFAVIEFQESSSYAGPNSIDKNFLNRSRFKKFLDAGSAARKADDSSLVDMHNPQVISPSVMNHNIYLKLGQHTLVMSEVAFVKLLNEIGPEYYSYSENQTVDERFLVEVARRDSVLADAIAVLKEFPNENISEFRMRLQQRITSRDSDLDTYKTFAEELRARNSIIRSKDQLNNIRWYGYSIHADYWRMREIDAEKYFELLKENLKDSPPRKNKEAQEADLRKAEAEAEKQVLKINEKRFRNHSEKVKSDVIDIAKFFTLFGIFLASFFGILHFLTEHIDRPKMPEFLKDLIVMIKPDETFFNRESDSIFFKESNPTNHSKNDVLGNLNDPNTKVHFKVSTNLSQMPLYLNLPIKKYSYSRHTYQLEAFKRQDEYVRPAQYLEIFTESKIVAHGNFLPLPSPSGYKILDINIKYSDEYLDSHAYEVYFDKLSGQSFAVLQNGSYENGSFHIETSYVPIQGLQYNPNDWKLDKTVLGNLNNHLKEIGETSISNSLDVLMSSQNQINVQDIAYAFGASAVYTFDKESMDLSSMWRNETPFDKYAKFLVNGTFHYQCSGSNSLFKDFMNTYTELAGGNSRIVAEPLLGFTFDGPAISQIGHQHTILHQNKPLMFVELDATPALNSDGIGSTISNHLKDTQDSFRRKTQIKEPKLPEEPAKPDVVAILPQRLRIQTQVLSDFYNPYSGPSGTQLFELLDKKIKAAIHNLESSTTRPLHENLESDFSDALSLIPYIRSYLLTYSPEDLLLQYIRLQHSVPLHRRDVRVEKFIQEKYRELLAKHEGVHLKALEEVAAAVHDKLLERYSKLQDSSILKTHSDLTSALFELLDFYKQFSKFEERRSYESGMCRSYFAS